jgi:phosphoglycerate dehydrogenase-like enzyme
MEEDLVGYTLVYWNKTTEDVYSIIRSEVPPGWTLLTPKDDTPATFRSALRDADFVLAANWPFGEEELRAAPKLRMVQHQGVGYDGMDTAALQARGIPLAICAAGAIVGVAEHTMLLILAVYKRLVLADTKMRQGTWLQWELRPTSYELAGKTLGLVGFGRIGQAVAQRAHAFEADILYTTRTAKTLPPVAVACGARRVTLEELLRQSDIVSLHLPLSAESRHFMGAREFRQMKPSAIFINTTRGGTVDEQALVTALETKTIAGAGLDVFEEEPVKLDNPLLRMDNVVLTPHISAGTFDALRQKARFMIANIQRFAEGQPIEQQVV